MRVALMGDLHANLPALEAVLEHSRQEGAEAIWNLGDLVGYGAFPEDVVKRLRSGYALSTLGAYDRQVVRFEKRKEKRPKKRATRSTRSWSGPGVSCQARAASTCAFCRRRSACRCAASESCFRTVAGRMVVSTLPRRKSSSPNWPMTPRPT